MPDGAKKQPHIVSFVIVGLGVFFLIWCLGSIYSIPRESELIEVSGVPTAVQEVEHESRHGMNRYLYFRLAGHAVIVPDHTPHYEEIAGIVRVNQPIKAGLSPRSESIIPVTEYVPVYRFEHDGNVILTYPEKVQDGQFLIYVLLFLGVTITLLGAWSLNSVRWQNKIFAMRESGDP